MFQGECRFNGGSESMGHSLHALFFEGGNHQYKRNFVLTFFCGQKTGI